MLMLNVCGARSPFTASSKAALAPFKACPLEPESKLVCYGVMNDLKKRIAKVVSEISGAKVLKKKQKRRVKIVRSFKGDTSISEALVKNTKRGIEASEAQRDVLVAELRTQEDATK